ncbi:SEC-C domain-containing protein [Kushneria sp. AK178]
MKKRSLENFNLNQMLLEKFQEFPIEKQDKLLWKTAEAATLNANDMCWCGSKKSFQDCHLGMQKKRALSYKEINNSFSRAFRKPRFCCASDFDKDNCNGSIKGAHTIQKSRVFSSFADKGHVGTFYQCEPLTFKERSVGINKEASTIYSFCEFHDSKLFHDIEAIEFQPSPENCWASSYRAICHEYYQKIAAKEALSWQKNYLSQGLSSKAQVVLDDLISTKEFDIHMGKYFVLKEKKTFEEIKIEEAYDGLTSYIITLDAPITVAVSGAAAPRRDILGNKIQREINTYNNDFQGFNISTVIKDSKAVYIVSHLRKYGTMGQYFNFLNEDNKDFVKKWLFTMIFLYIENNYFNLKWWKKLPRNIKNDIRQLSSLINDTQPISWENNFISFIPGSVESVVKI